MFDLGDEEVDTDDTVIVYYNMDCGTIYSAYLDSMMKWVADRNMHATLVTTWIHWPHSIAHVWVMPVASDRLLFALHWA